MSYRFSRQLAACVVGITAAILPFCVAARDSAPSRAYAPIEAKELPKQGQETLALIRKGGPFPYSKDGTIFGNREKALPLKARGYYREYTVKTPGSKDRGARRIVCGGADQRDCYYTADHYATFKRIVEPGTR